MRAGGSDPGASQPTTKPACANVASVNIYVNTSVREETSRYLAMAEHRSPFGSSLGHVRLFRSCTTDGAASKSYNLPGMTEFIPAA